MADGGWETIDGFSTTRSYADDVRSFLESQKAQLQLEDLAAAGPYWPSIAAGGSLSGAAPSTSSEGEESSVDEGLAVGAYGMADSAAWEEQRKANMDVLALDPPHWLPDSFASACGGCHLQFVPFRRLKHHCRWVRVEIPERHGMVYMARSAQPVSAEHFKPPLNNLSPECAGRSSATPAATSACCCPQSTPRRTLSACVSSARGC